MSRFNKNMLKNSNPISAGVPGTSADKEKITIGAGLLSPTSVSAIKEMEIIYVRPDDMFPSEDNVISMNPDEIEQLADSIMEVGLLSEPIIKEVESGRYRIVCGEKRYRATLLNIEKGRRSSEEKLRCKLFNPKLIDLPLNEDEKEDYVRDEENVLQRNKTDADRLMLIRKYEERYKLLRERDPERFKGIKTRDLLVKDLGMSASAIAQFKKIENKGSEELISAVEQDQVSITTAVGIADLEKSDQKELIEQALKTKKEDEKIIQGDVLKFKHDKKVSQVSSSTNEESKGKSEEEVVSLDQNDSKSPDRDVEEYTINDKVLKNDLKSVMKKLKNNQVVLDEKQYFSYLNLISNLEKLFN